MWVCENSTMCIFIHAAVPKDTDIQRLTPVFKQHGWRVTLAENESLQKQMPEDIVLRLTGVCDCSTVLGRQRPEILEDDLKKPTDEVARYKRKGWSQAKIDRAMADKMRHQETQTEVDKSQQTRQLSAWISFIEDVLQQKTASKFGVLYHMFNGSLVDDKVIIRHVHTNSTKNLERHLSLMEEDSLYWFKLK